MMSIPNVLHDSVPVGRSENENVVIREWGVGMQKQSPPQGTILILLHHFDLMDLERAQRFLVQDFIS